MERSLTLMNSMKALRHEGFGTDCDIRIGSEVIKAHRLVLAASSDYFKKMFDDNSDESKQACIELFDLDSKAVAECIDYLYSGEINSPDVERSEPILKASYILEINDLKDKVFKLLTDKKVPESCLLLRKYGLTYNDRITVQSCEEFISSHQESVAQSDHWLQLSLEDVIRCIVCSNVERTSTLWTMIVRWVEFDEKARKESIHGLLNLISPLDITAVFQQILFHPLVLNDECIEFLWRSAIQPNADHVARHLTTSNCFDLMSWAKRFRSQNLQEIVKNYMAGCFFSIATSGRLNELNYEEYHEVMANSCNASEDVKFLAISNWKKDDINRTESFIEFYRKLDLTKVSTAFIQDTIRKDPDISSNIQCLGLMMDALYKRVKN